MKGFMIIDSQKNTLVVGCKDAVIGELMTMSARSCDIKKHETKKALLDEIRAFLEDPEVKSDETH